MFALLPVIATSWLLYHMLAGGIVAVDFGREYWVAGLRVLNGGDPYAWSARQIAGGVSFPYPGFTAIGFASFALLSRGLSEALFTALCMLAALGTLRVLAVRDWRLYGLVMLWPPVVAAWQTANLTLLLVLGIGLIWRYRERPVVTGLLAALIVSLKPFTWPIGVWLLCTRRYRAAGWALAVGLVLNAAAWALLGGGAAGRYLRLSGEVTDALHRSGYGAIALAMQFGASVAVGTLLAAGCSIALAVSCLCAARRGREQEALTAAIGLMLTASPLVWNHYLALLIVPLALARPNLGSAWLVPLVLWLCPSKNPSAAQVVLVWAVAAGLILLLMRRPLSRDPARLARDPARLARDPAHLSRDPACLSRDPAHLSAASTGPLRNAVAGG
ncbi:MAG: glycosyltransferase family 87 protein [Solirubrobacteraceae bacterium]